MSERLRGFSLELDRHTHDRLMRFTRENCIITSHWVCKLINERLDREEKVKK